MPLAAAPLAAAHSELIGVRHPAGSAHGFIEVAALDGSRIAIGDWTQKVRGSVVTSRLEIHFSDGSLDDETTVFSQRGSFRLVSDHHVQKGPYFPNFLDFTLDVGKNLVTARDAAGHAQEKHLDLPPDVYNGMPIGLLMNVSPDAPETKIAMVAPTDKPRLVHLSMKNGGEVSFMVGGRPRKAIDYIVHVELGGVTGVVAPLIGKEPRDYHVWILTGPDPAFVREEGTLYQGGPVMRIQQISAAFPP